MITQGIKRWLQNLFSWWPWKHSSETDYAHTASTLNKSTTQDALFFTAVDGTYAQPDTQLGTTSVAVEPLEANTSSESIRPVSEERSFSSMKVFGEEANESSTSSIVEERKKVPREGDAAAQIPLIPATPTPQQRLEFLRYLVERGIVNEGYTRKP